MPAAPSLIRRVMKRLPLVIAVGGHLMTFSDNPVVPHSTATVAVSRTSSTLVAELCECGIGFTSVARPAIANEQFRCSRRAVTGLMTGAVDQVIHLASTCRAAPSAACPTGRVVRGLQRRRDGRFNRLPLLAALTCGETPPLQFSLQLPIDPADLTDQVLIARCVAPRARVRCVRHGLHAATVQPGSTAQRTIHSAVTSAPRLRRNLPPRSVHHTCCTRYRRPDRF